MSREFTYAEVAKHNKSDDLWIVVDGKVLDVTKFQEEHPGGEEVIQDLAGKDASTEFEDVGHSADARKQIDDFVVGTIKKSEQSEKKAASSGSTSEGGVSLGVLLAMVAVAGLAFGFRFFLTHHEK
eukprot:Rmarinus@m.26832